MKFYTLKRTLVVSALGLATLLGTSGIANAQNNRQGQRQPQKVYQQQQRTDNHPNVNQQNQRNDNQRNAIDQQRLHQQQIAEQQRLNAQRIQQQQEAIRLQNQRQAAAVNRYRVNRNGRQYQIDNRQADLLKQAVNMGYQQGFQAGQTDRSSRRGGIYSNSSIYQNGNYGYQSYVDSSLYQDYFRQGFQRGYDDGYNSRYQYGSFSNGGVSILGTILNGILSFQSF